MTHTAEKDVPPHECDTGHFDRTICPEPCGYMHSYCATCGERQDPCAHEARPIPPEGHDHEKCCTYLRCAHPACCGYHGQPRPIPPGGDPTTDHGVYRCECETDAHEKPHTRVFPPAKGDDA